MLNNITLNTAEMTFSAIRAQGSGGQHVNKVSTAIHLQFSINDSSLSERHKEKLLSFRDDRISKEGVITIKAQRFRSQDKNKQDAVDRLQQLIQEATKEQKIRRATKPTKASQRRRIDSKVKKGSTKQLRKKPLFSS
jgi:ribosome-associated protein